jgi:hypothetical protein
VRYNTPMSPDEQVLDVLKFMAAHTVGRPLIHGEIASTYERWDTLKPSDKERYWSRCRRRFAAAQPTLAMKDRIRDADECVHLVAHSLLVVN